MNRILFKLKVVPLMIMSLVLEALLLSSQLGHAQSTVVAPAASIAADGVVQYYAILINSSGEAHSWNEVSLIYPTLLTDYHMPAEHILLLNNEGTDPTGENPNGMIDGPATVDSITSVINSLAAQLDADDQLLIWVTGQGYGYEGVKTPFYGYLSGRTSVDPDDEQDYLERDFKLRSFSAFWNGEVRNMGLNVLLPSSAYDVVHQATILYRARYVSQFDNLDFEREGVRSDSDFYIERLVDYALGDTNRDGWIDTNAGERFDYDGDGIPPYDRNTDSYDEDDWGKFDSYDDNYTFLNTVVPGERYLIFDQDFDNRLDIDINYDPNHLKADGTDLDNQGLFDGIDINDDGDMDDWISIDEALALPGGPLYDDELATLLNQFHVKVMSIFMAQHFSGGFIDDLSAPNRILETATEEDALIWNYHFGERFTDALHRAAPNGSPVDADSDHNGCISMVEAFDYASVNDTGNQIPQYDDNGDGVGHAKTIPNGSDGALGAQTYLSDCQRSALIVVNSTADPGDGICDQNQCTLREAIQRVNAGQVPMTITFAIPGQGAQTIRPLSPLPEINRSVLIDGYTQPGSQANTNPTTQGLNTVLTIELDGNLAGGNGLTFSGGTSTVRGLVINRFSGYALLTNAFVNLEGNFIGVDPTGQVNVGGGALFAAPGSTLRIGDLTVAARNLIVGAIGAFNGQIEMRGNLVGVDRSGLIFLSRSDIFIGKSGITLGGTTPEARNIVIGKISVDRSSPLDIQGNYLGVDVTGQKILGEGSSLYGTGNGNYRVLNNIINGSSFDGVTFDTSYGSQLVANVIEGHRGAGVRLFDSLFSEVSNNTIDGNGGAGIAMLRSVDSKNKISSNSIFNNRGLGIDLKNDGVTLNDIGDGDVGDNQLQNFPELTRLEHGGNNTVVVGMLNSKPNSSYHVELFYGPTCDESGYGEGEKFITGVDVATDSSGNSQFGVKLSTLPDGYYVTATATDSQGNSSEFSKCIRVSLSTATITIKKETQPKSMQDFAYYGPFGKFYLDDAQPDDNDGFASFKTFEVNPGTYNFAEGVFQSWHLADIVCTGSGQSSNTLSMHSVGIKVKAGDQMICTFVTQRRVDLDAFLYNDLNANHERDANEPGLPFWEFRFYRDDGTLINHNVTDATGSAKQSNVIPGNFKVCETPKAGWSGTQYGWSDPITGVPCYQLTLPPGQSYQFVFGVTQASTVINSEEMNPANGVLMGELPDINELESDQPFEQEFGQHTYLPLINR